MVKDFFLFFCCLFITLGVLSAQPPNKRLKEDGLIHIPIPAKLPYTQQTQMLLNGQWVLNDKWRIMVPGELEMQGFTVADGMMFTYSRIIELPAAWRGQRIRLRFDGVNSYCIVSINGKMIMEHEGGFVPFEADVTEQVAFGKKNRLTVKVKSRTLSDILNCTSQYAAHNVCGITRKVVLYSIPSVHISDQTIVTEFDTSYTGADLKLVSKIQNSSSGYSSVKLRYVLTDPSGKTVFDQSQPGKIILPGQSLGNSLSVHLKNPKQWDPEHPYLYTLYTHLLVDNHWVQINKEKVGFRQVRIFGNQLLLNGKPIKLKGVNRHDIYPISGRSVSYDLCRKDAQLFVEGNCNYIRTAHYPPAEEFLNAADEFGLLVESESAFCWVGHPGNPTWGKWDYRDESFFPQMLRANLEKMIAEKNHPSIIIWSLANESYWSQLWEKINRIVKEFDSTRPTSFHDQCWGNFNNMGSKADIAVYHYPSIEDLPKTDTLRRPVLFGEYFHVPCYNRRELETDPGLRAMYGTPLREMFDSVQQHQGCLGGAIWAGIDDIFIMPGGQSVGYGEWGVIDGWRRPKPEYFGMKKAYSPVVVRLQSQNQEMPNELCISIENRYVFTNLKEITTRYKTDDNSWVILHPDISPQVSAPVVIPINKDTRKLCIQFIDKKGLTVNEERFQLKDTIPIFRATYPFSITEDSLLVSLRVGEVDYYISKRTGGIQAILKQNRIIVYNGPDFMLVPMNRDNGGKIAESGADYQKNILPLPDYSLPTEVVTSFNIIKNDSAVVVKVHKNYREAKGIQTFSFLANGIVKSTVEITTYTGNDTLPRQYGLAFSLPKSFATLSWKSQQHYTDNCVANIGRTEGEAHLLPYQCNKFKQPTVFWKDDFNDFGSNDFRSTKLAIRLATLRNSQNDRLEIISDGKQSVRSWLQDGRIQCLIAEYSNNGSEPFYTNPQNIGQINIKGKIMRACVAFRIL